MEKGTYAIILALGEKAHISVGKLGQFAFPAGYYLYAGSARGGLYPRVKRHLRREKRLRWHIDYLLQFADVIEVWYAEGSAECLWAQRAGEMPQARIIACGFGSSDCRCPSHLVYFPFPPSFELFQQKLREGGKMLSRSPPQQFLG